MESIKDKVAIVGMGCTKFGELWDKGVEGMLVEAAYEAFEDAGIEPSDIQAAWVGTVYSGETGACLTVPLRLQYIPVTRVENRCGTAHDALRNACYGIASGAYDIVLALGFEKQKDFGMRGLNFNIGELHPVLAHGHTGPSQFALRATRYFATYGLSREEGKELLAKVAVKNRHNGTLHPKAHMQKEVTLEQVIHAPIICWPLGLFDCCPVTDGAAAAVLTRADMAKGFRDDYVLVKGLGLASGPGDYYGRDDFEVASWEEVRRSAQAAYNDAGIKDPLNELDLVGCHDCFSIAEIIVTEELGLCPRGQAKDYINEGTFTMEGKLPVNIDGGLLAFGHPIGASGLRMLYEIYKQIQGKAGPRQRKNVNIGLAQNFGGGYGAWNSAVTIVGR